jgi:uncharacterized membrane protein YphA (DoxX/SURF4 family)
MHSEVEPKSVHHPAVRSALRKVLAGVVLVVAVALAIKIVLGLITTIFYVVAAVAIVVGILWALKTLIW